LLASSPLVLAAPNTTGNRKVIAIRINFPDHRHTHSFDAVTNKLQSVKRNFDKYSYGKYNLIVTVTPRVYTMPHNAGWYTTAGSLAAAAERAVNNSGFATVPGPFRHVGIFFTGTKFGWGGLATKGGKRFWVKSLGATEHEMGHNLGFDHPYHWVKNSASNNPIGLPGVGKKGDTYSFMKRAGVSPKAREAHLANWITNNTRFDHTRDGVYMDRLYNIDQKNVSAGRKRCIRVDRKGQSKQWVWLQYRSKLLNKFSSPGKNYGLQKGLQIYYQRKTDPSLLCDYKAGGALDNAHLPPYVTLHDGGGDLYITNLGTGGTLPDKYMDVSVIRGGHQTNIAPTATWDAPLAVPAGAPVTITVTPSDPDGDACVGVWTTGNHPKVFKDNSLSLTHTWELPGPDSVSVDVLDLHGGTVTLTQPITVLDIFGRPEPSAHVAGFTAFAPSNEIVNMTWADAGGADPPYGYVLYASTTPGFTDPVDLSAPAIDPDLSDGEAVVYVRQGLQSHQFSGLAGTTPYYFAIYPYANTGVYIDFKTEPPAPMDAATTPSGILLADGLDYTLGNGVVITSGSPMDYTELDGIVSDAQFGSANEEIVSDLRGRDFTTGFTETLNEFTWSATSFMRNVNANNANFSGLVLNGGTATGAFRGTSLVNADFSGTMITAGAKSFHGATGKNATFVGATFNLSGMDHFAGAKMTGWNFSGATFSLAPGATLFSDTTTARNSNWIGADMSDPDFLSTELELLDGTGPKFYDAGTTIFPVGFPTDASTLASRNWFQVTIEPSGSATLFSASSLAETIDLSWTDATGVVPASGYLILANTTNIFVEPVDGVSPTADSNLKDGKAVVHVPAGAQAYRFSRLPGGVAYYFRIYSYTNGGSLIDFKLLPGAPGTSALPPVFTGKLLRNNVVYNVAAAGGNINPDEVIDYVQLSTTLANVKFGHATIANRTSDLTDRDFSIEGQTFSMPITKITWSRDGFMRYANAKGVSFSGLELRGNNLTEFAFANLKCQNSDFSDCVINGGYRLFFRAKVNETDFSNAIITAKKSESFRETSGKRANFAGVQFFLSGTNHFGGKTTSPVNPLQMTGWNFADCTFEMRGHNTTNNIASLFNSKSEAVDSNWAGVDFSDPNGKKANGDPDPGHITLANLRHLDDTGPKWYDDSTVFPAGFTTNITTREGKKWFKIVGEPTDQPTNFRVAVTSATGLRLNWTDATGVIAPYGYLILGSTHDDFVIPSDAEQFLADGNLSDGFARVYVPAGRQTRTFSGLSTADTTYYFAIIPYSNTGYAIDYKNVPDPLTVSTGESPTSYADWIATFPGVGGLSSPADDPDGDGVVNLFEYSYFHASPGMSPAVHGAIALLPSASRSASNQLVLHLRRADDLPPNLTMTIQGSDDLGVADPWIDISGMVTEANDGPNGIVGTASSNFTYTQIHAIGSGLDKKYMRVLVREN
jgi:uncharacterized protein YjbI with pentapeptide repeats